MIIFPLFQKQRFLISEECIKREIEPDNSPDSYIFFNIAKNFKNKARSARQMNTNKAIRHNKYVLLMQICYYKV